VPKMLPMSLEQSVTYVYNPYRQALFCFVFFVATKKMTLLSGNPDDIASIFELQSTMEKCNRLIICCTSTMKSG